MKVFVVVAVAVLAFQVTAAYARSGYEAKIKCASSKSLTFSEHFYADDDLEAMSIAQKKLDQNTAYRNKGCAIVEIVRR